MRFLGAALLALTALAALTSCEKTTAAAGAQAIQAAPQLAYAIPTATEAFHLRSECVKLGEKLLEDDIVGIALTKSQVSHYNPKTNRCYVNITVMTADLNGPMDYISNTLLDGQTGDMLAHTKNKKGEKTGMAFGKSGVYGFDGVNEYILSVMNDE